MVVWRASEIVVKCAVHRRYGRESKAYLKGEVIYPVHEVFIEEVAVLVFLDTGVEKAGPVLQTEFPHLPQADEHLASQGSHSRLAG